VDYVYANNTGEVLYAPTGAVWMNTGDVWHADDPFVAFRPDLFSSTPVVVRSTTGKEEHPPATPVGEPKRRGRAK
jgi:hypothetical protein